MPPKEFLNNMKALLGSEYELFLRALDEKPAQALRINGLKQNAARLSKEFIGESVPWEKTGYYIKEGTRPGTTLAHAAGAFYIQDASAMAAVAALNPKPGEIVLDLCAAPGGKSGQIASRLNGRGALVSNEYVKNRAAILKSNIERLGVTNCAVTRAPSESFARLGETFDAVLVDAPCSGEGMFRKDEEAVREWTPSSPASCAARQKEILNNAAKALKRGGRLAYSTCTFNKTENEDTIEAFLSEHTDFETLDFRLEGAGESKNGCLRLWPHKIRGEGHFVCLLKKKGETEPCAAKEAKQDKAAMSIARDVADMCLNRMPEGLYIQRNEELFLRSPALPDLRGIYALSDGLSFARTKGKMAEPSHALAMSINPNEAQRHINLSAEQAIKYMEGEELKLALPKDWTLVCFEDLPLGWGKSTGEALKNHLPKGLRLRGGHSLRA